MPQEDLFFQKISTGYHIPSCLAYVKSYDLHRSTYPGATCPAFALDQGRFCICATAALLGPALPSTSHLPAACRIN